MTEELVALAEEPGLHLPSDPGSERIDRERYSFLVRRSGATVERLRLEPGETEAALLDVRSLARERGLSQVTWWVGERASAGVAARLAALGLVPDPETPRLTELALLAPPAGAPRVEVRRVGDLEEYLAALGVDWEVRNMAAEEREARRALAREAWPAVAADAASEHYLAVIDGEPVGFGRLALTPVGGLMLGGSTLPKARGRGVYTALVHARWQEAVARGTPALVVAAGNASTPILERLGFERLGAILLLLDRL